MQLIKNNNKVNIFLKSREWENKGKICKLRPDKQIILKNASH